MNEEKNLNEEVEETVETPEETVEEAVETSEETVEEEVEAEAAPEITEATEDYVEAAEEIIEEAVESAQTAEEASEAADEAIETVEAVENETEDTEAAIVTEGAEKKQLPVAKIALGAAAVVVVAAIVVLAIMFMPKIFNKYNRAGYIDVSGRTIAEVAESSGMDLKDFLDSYGLPADMPSNTSESAAYYTIPCSRMAAMYGMDFETLKSTLELPDTVTEDTTWGEAEGEARLSVYVGEDNLASFKEQYNLGDEITGDTQWKEIRNIVDEYNRQQRIEAEKEEKKAEKEAENTEATAEAETEATAAPAE